MAEPGAIADAWYSRALGDYPADARAFLRENADPFRNPVGSTLRDSLRVLAAEVCGGMDAGRIAPALDAIVRLRAVQDFTAANAVGFVFALKDILRERGDWDATLDRNIDELALMAFDAYTRCREQIVQLRVAETARARFVQEARR